jgi:hypothetical protein
MGYFLESLVKYCFKKPDAKDWEGVQCTFGKVTTACCLYVYVEALRCNMYRRDHGLQQEMQYSISEAKLDST